MNTGHFELLTRVQEYVSDLFRTRVKPEFVFHNLVHTQEVVAACEEMAEHYKLPDEDRLALAVAAWFHDSGYSKGSARDHEAESVKLATTFLQINNVSDSVIQKTTACIEATRIPQSPSSLASNIICDADLFHLGSADFFEKSKLLRRELNTTREEKISKKEWRKINIKFLEDHRYFTDYARKKLGGAKQEHLEEFLAKEKKNEEKPELKEEKKKEKKEKKDDAFSPDDSGKKEKKEKDPTTKNERGISTMFRIMSNSQNTLSGMADSKANIMISVNSIIISIVISGLLTVVMANQHLVIPFFLMIIVCVSAIVFSILATRPKVTKGRFTEEDIHEKKVNLLFFGNFYNMNLDDYEWGMKELLGDRDYLYDTMIKDIYFLGIVLAKKYKFLRISYNIFMYGLILVVLTFAAAILLFERQAETLG